ncbi:MAG TPA: hypothetical protein VGK38_05190, partial [Prolixibacteraceae bacterium]
MEYDLMNVNRKFIERIAMMDGELNIPLPVRFNPFKHHRNYILSKLKTSPRGEIIHLLDQLCNNYIDIYTGAMTPDSICTGIIDILKSNHVFGLNDFTGWVSSKIGYRQVRLEDQSEWIIRKGDEIERYIHIHPTHAGSFSIRFKGSTLKTIYLLKSGFASSYESITLESVNDMRIQIGLSPVQKLDRSRGILKCYN